MLPTVVNLMPSMPTVPAVPETETTQTLVTAPSGRLEHIISRGQPSPPNFWYDQPDDEWVVLLRGTATLDFGEEGSLNLKAGDCLTIAAHQNHRVAEVSHDAVWVALHFKTSG